MLNHRNILAFDIILLLCDLIQLLDFALAHPLVMLDEPSKYIHPCHLYLVLNNRIHNQRIRSLILPISLHVVEVREEIDNALVT